VLQEIIGHDRRDGLIDTVSSGSIDLFAVRITVSEC
jgi:hypothetical protein